MRELANLQKGQEPDSSELELASIMTRDFNDHESAIWDLLNESASAAASTAASPSPAADLEADLGAACSSDSPQDSPNDKGTLYHEYDSNVHEWITHLHRVHYTNPSVMIDCKPVQACDPLAPEGQVLYYTHSRTDFCNSFFFE